MKHQVFVAVPLLSEGCPPHPGPCQGHFPGLCTPDLGIAGWACGNESFRNGGIEGKTTIGSTDTGLPGGWAELGPPRVQVRKNCNTTTQLPVCAVASAGCF